MINFDHITQLNRLFNTHRYGLTTERLMRELGCGRSTLYRGLDHLRDVLQAPLVSDGKRPCTWRYAPESGEFGKFELPGVWLRANELFLVVLSEQLLGQSGAGTLLGDAMWRIQPRIEQMFGAYAKQLGRIRVVRVQARQVDEAIFRCVADAVVKRRQLAFTYGGRDSGETSARRVSPQRLTHYRDNWYLEAFDEGVADMRTFAIDRIAGPALKSEAARELPQAELEALRAAGYGIFSGPVIGTATLRFSARAARWVGEECWHPKQQHRWLDDGRLELTVPYASSRELLMDVLRHGPDAEIVGPAPLRAELEGMLEATLAVYRAGTAMPDEQRNVRAPTGAPCISPECNPGIVAAPIVT